jgi:hypothetical protein
MYYPKSQIKPDLYTNGGEYILSTTQEEYKGYYYRISSGQAYTGKNPQQGYNILLTSLSPNILTPTENIPSPPKEIEILYDSDYNAPNTPLTRSIPQFNPTIPTDQNKQNGQFTRYFCKKNNELVYSEINLETYTQLSTQNPQIAWDLYTPASLTWQIQGDKNSVYASNQSSVYLVEKNQNWYGFSQYFKGDFLKYYLA